MSREPNPLRGWQVDRASIRNVGHDLQRPECILAERLVALTSEGEFLTLLDDGDAQAITHYDQHFWVGSVTPDLMATCKGTLAPWMASLTFGGPDLKTVYLGSLMGHTLPSFRSPVAGLLMAHWRR